MACHSHRGTADSAQGPVVRGDADFAPELSRLAAKLKPAVGKNTARRWLVQWIINPNVHHPRTRMPVTHLSVDQANDVAAWLLAQPVRDWDGKDPKATEHFQEVQEAYDILSDEQKRKAYDQFGHAGVGGRLPRHARHRLRQLLRGRIGLDQQAGIADGRFLQDEVWLQNLVLLGDLGVERLRHGLAFEQGFWGEVERLAQDEANPGVVRGRVVRLGLPLVVGEA